VAPVNLKAAMSPPALPNVGKAAFEAQLANDPVKKKLVAEFDAMVSKWQTAMPEEVINPGDSSTKFTGKALKTLVEHNRKKLLRTNRTLVPGWAAWTAVGLPIGGPKEGYKCRASFLAAMVVCDPRNSTVTATVTCFPEMWPRPPHNLLSATSRGWGLKKTFDVGCDCHRRHPGKKGTEGLKMILDGTMPSKMASICSGRMAQWSNEAKARSLNPERAETCAAVAAVACKKALSALKPIKAIDLGESVGRRGKASTIRRGGGGMLQARGMFMMSSRFQGNFEEERELEEEAELGDELGDASDITYAQAQ